MVFTSIKKLKNENNKLKEALAQLKAEFTDFKQEVADFKQEVAESLELGNGEKKITQQDQIKSWLDSQR